MILLSDISSYHRVDKDVRFVLQRVNLTVGNRDRVGVFGQSGSGKSALARIACKIERPNAGQVIHSGVVSWPIGVSAFLHKEMSGEDNVRTISGLLGGDADRILTFVSSFSGIGTLMSQHVGTYSSFARDRLAMACSLAFPADTYVVDGIPALGDKAFQARCIAKLETRLANAGLLLLSKNRHHLERLCNRFFALRDGMLFPASSAEHAEVLTQNSMEAVD